MGFCSGAVGAGAYAAGALPNGASTAQGSTTDTPCTLPASATACSQVAVEKAVASALNSAGAISQATPGTTNGVAIVGVNGATALAGAGAVGTGSPRVAVGQDATTVAGSAPVKGGVGVVNGGSTYQLFAASSGPTALAAARPGITSPTAR
jgi:hypothetical protein